MNTKWLSPVFAAMLLVGGWNSPARSQTRAAEAGAFDYYVLALSWSPNFCERGGNAQRSEQCREGHDAILHGLWPQYEKGWPEFCATRHPLRLPARLLDAYDPMTPDRGLLAYQWRKHGVCSGLSPEDYFNTAERLWRSVRMPAVLDTPQRQASFSRDDLVHRIVGVNSDLSPEMLVLTCDGRRLNEIRVCFDKGGRFRPCGADVRAKSCRRSPMIVLPVSAN